MIFHIAARAEWKAALREGAYMPASLAAEGFIHCSTREQIITTANLFYRGRHDLMLIVIDEGRLTAPMRYEAPVTANDVRAASQFPHIYGALSLDAVIRA
ncbi:MAG TPA: DUF952 domain-containing protein, partial [Candidatus Binataceae bacterium]|nr:DUF952 domain-containing protein [Candidatus Binataceae bacterium]